MNDVAGLPYHSWGNLFSATVRGFSDYNNYNLHLAANYTPVLLMFILRVVISLHPQHIQYRLKQELLQ